VSRRSATVSARTLGVVPAQTTVGTADVASLGNGQGDSTDVRRGDIAEPGVVVFGVGARSVYHAWERGRSCGVLLANLRRGRRRRWGADPHGKVFCATCSSRVVGSR
jgi:hypothetical protein